MRTRVLITVGLVGEEKTAAGRLFPDSVEAVLGVEQHRAALRCQRGRDGGFEDGQLRVGNALVARARGRRKQAAQAAALVHGYGGDDPSLSRNRAKAAEFCRSVGAWHTRG